MRGEVNRIFSLEYDAAQARRINPQYRDVYEIGATSQWEQKKYLSAEYCVRIASDEKKFQSQTGVFSWY